MFKTEATAGPVHILRPAGGSDLLKELEKYVRDAGINLAWLSGVGAVSRATLRYYDQVTHQWEDLQLEKRLEVVSIVGNVSLLNGEPIVHVHATLSDEEGACYGGHLAYDTLVFNMEIMLQTLSGAVVTRVSDPVTGLSLWQ